MSKIQTSYTTGFVSPQTEPQPTAESQRPSSTYQSPEGTTPTPISEQESHQRRVEHNLGGLAQEVRLRDGQISSVAKQDKQDRSPEARANELIQSGYYREASQVLRNYIGTSPIREARLRPLQRQAEVLIDMQARGVQNIQHPPSEQNVRDYFGTMQGQPIQVIRQRYENYANAYFSHSDSGPFRTGDRDMPRNWQALTTMRTPDARYQLDCEGFAYMGRIALESAGFTNLRFADMRPSDGSPRHMVITGTRQQGGSTEIAMISNNTFQTTSPTGRQRLEQARSQLLQREFENIIRQTYDDGDRIVQDRDMAAAEERE